MCGMDLFLDVGLTGENDDRDRLQFRVAVPFPEKHPAVCNGHYQVEQDAGRMPGCVTQILESFVPVLERGDVLRCGHSLTPHRDR